MKLWLKIVIIVLVLALAGGGIAGIVKLADSDKLDNKTISTLAYSVGGLDNNGNYMNTDESIYTKNAFECQGLNCALSFDSVISYQIYFYDQNNDFVHTTGKLTGAFVKDSVPFFAKYARIVITPNDDNKVSRLEVTKYAKQLKVTVYREQGFKNYTENLLIMEKSGYTLDESGEEIVSSDPVKCISTFINISSYKESMVFREAYDLVSSGYVYFYDSNKHFLGRLTFQDLSSVVFTSSEGVTYYKIDFVNLSFVASYMRFSYGTTGPFEVYCR